MSGQNETTIRPQFHHVNLKTTQLQEMIDWYGEVVGIEVTHQSPGGAFVTNDEANHRIALASPPGLSDDPEKLAHTGIHHTGFEYGSVDDLLSTYERLKAGGIEPHMAMDHGMTTSIYYVDPDGNSVELQSDNFGDCVSFVDFLEKVEAWVPGGIGRIYAIMDNPRAHRAYDVLLFNAAHPRWEFVFQPKYAAYLNLIEPWWKTLRSLALAGRFFETWEEIEEAIERAKDYWNEHRHPYVWGRRRRHRAARRPGIGAMPTVPAVVG